MGLDMYLSKKTYVKNWDHMTEGDRHTVTVVGPRAAHIRPERITEIVEQVMYWRKANAIHAWFVREAQDGLDNCQESEVTPEQLTELRDLCQTLLAEYDADPVAATTFAQRLLPTQSGFFFGDTSYDAYYWEDLRDTARSLTALLAETDDTDWGVTYTYQASW